MPLINLIISSQENPALAEQLAKTISDRTKDVLNKRPEAITVIVSFVPDHLWFINSASLAELKAKSFNLNIKIADSTNLKIDKSRYIEAVHAALSPFGRHSSREL